MSSLPDKIDVSQRSAPIIENPDGSFTWANRDYPNYDEAYNARRFFRAITFGIVYGGGGLLGTNA
jgi:hypothetical protein